MEAIFADELITSMREDVFQDIIAEMFKKEVENQTVIARNLGYDEDFIAANIQFNVFNHDYRQAHISEMPCIYIFFERSEFKEDRQFLDENTATSKLIIELYAAGVNSEDKNTADYNADKRLQYLRSQVYKIFMSEAAETLRCNYGIKQTLVKSWERIVPKNLADSIQTVLAGRWIFELTFDESTKQLDGREIKEIYFGLKIRDEFINPLVQILLGKNGGSNGSTSD